MKRIREEFLPMLTDDYGGNAANHAIQGDSDLELGFRYLEEIEEEAEEERLASLEEIDRDLPPGNLGVPNEYIYSLEETVTSALEARWHRSFKEVEPVRHILLSWSMAGDNNLIGNCSSSFYRLFGAYYATIFPLYTIIAKL